MGSERARKRSSEGRPSLAVPGVHIITRGRPMQDAPAARERLAHVASRFTATSDVKQRLAALVQQGSQLQPMPPGAQVPANQVMGCTSQVWLTTALDAQGGVDVRADSDSAVSRGLAAVLISIFQGCTPEEINAFELRELEDLALGPALQSPSRANAFRNMLSTLQKRARALAGDLPRFPSLLITADALEPQGAYAEAQARFLRPQAEQVERLAGLLAEKRIGVVAHFYMDPEVQGVLSTVAEQWPHVAISDSLVMASKACAMAEAGCAAVCVLGVDFMSENVRAILDDAGHTDVAVYRMAADAIGCSLAEAAESEAYGAYLAEAQAQPNSMHVVYINTSLRTKAVADAAVPTITCTSSNVVQTVLQAFAQVPDLHVWYGPDTYMGRNLQQLFTSLAHLPDEAAAALHPAHTAATVRECLPRLHHFQQGTCVVHEIFGGETCAMLRAGYSDAFITAHFEVPGEMFTLALEAQRERGMGVVGSTSNILGFIRDKVEAAAARGFRDRLQFVLGTESGMITSIVRSVQALLRGAGPAAAGVEVEIVFPVSPESITTRAQASAAGPAALPGGLAVVPGPAGGEGCSLEGGCAACPYMKMNTLAALLRVCERVGTDAGEALLEPYRPNAYTETVGGKTMAQAGCRPILHMNDYMQTKRLPDALVDDIRSR